MFGKIRGRLPKRPRLRVPKGVRNALIGMFVLLVLFVGGGVGYTYMMGQQTDEEVLAVATADVEPMKPPIGTPSKPRPGANVGASVQMVTSPVIRGSNASVTIRTTPEATCTITVVYDKVASTDSGLTPKVADAYGTVSWTWTVGKTVPLGKWPVNMTCEYAGKFGVVKADLEVAATLPE